MRSEDLHEATYRGAVFFVSGSTVEGGRKSALKEFVSSDRQVVEDLGLRQRTFTVEGAVAALVDVNGNEIRSYLDVRRELLLALELGGPGVLVHPFFGRLEGIHCRTYSLRENMSALGDAPISITFAISTSDGRPAEVPTVLGEVETAASTVRLDVETDITDRFKVTAAFIGNFEAARDKVNAVFDAIDEATAPFVMTATGIDAFSATLADLGQNVASLVQDPATLATSITGLFTTVNGLFATPRATYDSMLRLFPFGDGDVIIPTTTASRTERRQNQDAINSGVQAMALSGAYFAAAKLDLKNEAEIDEVSDALEAQWQKMLESTAVDPDVLSELSDMRVTVTSFFDEQRVTRPRIVEVTVNPISLRLLSFQFYGTSEFGDDLGRLNAIYDGALVSGRLKILTEEAVAP